MSLTIFSSVALLRSAAVLGTSLQGLKDHQLGIRALAWTACGGKGFRAIEGAVD